MPQQRTSTGGGETSGGPPLLASRLAPPALPEPMLWRPRLLGLLDDGVAGSLTLVRAPAGWGKTTLLTAWARGSDRDQGRQQEPPAWVQVEAGDSGERLWAYLAAALREAGRAGPTASSTVTPPRPEQVESLAAELATRERPVRLVLDDLHRVTDPAVLTGLEFLLRHADGRLRLVAAARADLPPALHRLRLAGDLTELGPDDLAFTVDEVADLMVAHGVPLPAAAVGRLRERTGGWPAGLRFAVLAARQQPDPARWVQRFGGDHPDVAAYLRAEVLTQLPPPARELLRRCAVGGAVRADLADTLTGRTDSGQVLAGLVREGGFLHRDDSDPPWYRPHPMLGDLLRQELAALDERERGELHRRAADWHADHDRPADALRHALTAGQWDRATELLLTHWPELVPYQTSQVPPPPPPPAEAVRRDPELALAAGTERAYAGDTEMATSRLRDAVAAARTLPVPRRDRFRRLAGALELTLARLAGDHPEVRRRAVRLLAVGTADAGMARAPMRDGPPAPSGMADAGTAGAPMRDGPPVPPGVADAGVAGAPTDDDPRTGEDADVGAVAGTALGLTDLAEGNLVAARTRFAGALAAARRSGRPRTELVGATRTALLLALAGELSPAEETARAALAMPPCQGWSSRIDCGYAHLALALVALYRDQPAEATAELAAAGAALGTVGTDPAVATVELAAAGAAGGVVDTDPAVAVVGAVAALCRAALLRDSGEPAAAIEVALRARNALSDVREAAGGGELADRLLAVEVDVRGEQGDLDTARRLLAERATRQPDPTPVLALALARVELRAGDVRAATGALPDWDAPDAADWPLSVRLAAGVLDAVLSRRAGDGRRAGRRLERVLDLAGRHGHRRVFTRAEPEVRDVLAAHLDSGTAYWPQVSELVRDAETPAGQGAGGPHRGAGETVPALGEPLTERELTILRYLQSILSNVEIASELSLSVNTVKTHVRNIYRKLDATRRREAVHRARALHLL
ncbi:LuxR C-terminal-related transcriptional regulator [Micromonospora sp. WMMD714]|uniref:LuxR C-terminal-related transcriptional regulator n=1 Tax=Micromonospora sp. WMMD714 TaxID=3016097 RepID=UPI00249BCF39|nr:LuxR C-terminal-related transcriptional regulator [Micromonospora sp. WMMD714]WFE67260.1 LuxR C-terminal-related transcriptional regulator [Micromonospora sp. WMMD714]